MLRIPHRHVNNKRDRDQCRQVIVEPGLVADGLEPQRDGFGGAVEDRYG